jgi:hypothetical protein
MDGTFIVPSPTGSRWAELESVSLELARQTQGKLFEKHILSVGSLIHPKTGERLNVDDAFLGKMVTNFKNNVCDIVQVPLANDDNQHVENADVNKGEVTELRHRNGKLYAVVDAREDAQKFGKTYLGASAFLSTNYTDTRTGQKAGPTLLHVAITNRPYVVGLEPFKEIIAATAASDNDAEIVVLTQQEEITVPTKEELLAQLKAEHGIDVEALQASAAQPPIVQGLDPASLTAALTAALQANPALQLSASNPDQITTDDIVGSVVELSRQNTVLAAGYEGLRRDRATEVVDRLISDGYVFPKQRTFAINLKLSNEEQFAEFVPADKVVHTNEQTGLAAPRDEHETAQQESEVVRLSKVYADHIVSSNNGRRH